MGKTIEESMLINKIESLIGEVRVSFYDIVGNEMPYDFVEDVAVADDVEKAAKEILEYLKNKQTNEQKNTKIKHTS